MRPLIMAVFVLGVALAAHASETPPDGSTVKEAPAVVATTTTPSAVLSAKNASQGSLAVSSPTVAAAQAKPVVEVSSSSAPVSASAPVKLASCVAPMQSLVTFHEKEIASIKRMIDRWQEKVEAATERREGLEQEVQSTLKQADEQFQLDTKPGKREADRLRKQAARIAKDIASIEKELKSQSKELAEEVRDVSKDAQQALKDAYQQTIEAIRKSQD